jgi:hypothetical protein
MELKLRGIFNLLISHQFLVHTSSYELLSSHIFKHMQVNVPDIFHIEPRVGVI